METISVQERYGSIKPGVDYRIVEDGYDFIRIRYQGKGIYIPKKFTERSKKRSYHEELPTYEDIVSEEEI